jgi:hypothetical protein
MSIKDEIAALRAEIAAKREKSSAAAQASNTSPDRDAGVDGTSGAQSIEAFMKLFGETLDELPNELDRYPRLTAFAAFGVGLAFGAFLGRRLR